MDNKILDKDIIFVEDIDGELYAHVDGFIYEGDDGLKLTEFTGVLIPLQELGNLDTEGKNNLIEQLEEESRQYTTDLGDIEVEEAVKEVYSGDILPITLEELPLAEVGVYYLV